MSNVVPVLFSYTVGEEVVFSGEWCREVLDDFLSSSTSGQKGVFAGRGVQYHLGFHHYSDTCRYEKKRGGGGVEQCTNLVDCLYVY